MTPIPLRPTFDPDKGDGLREWTLTCAFGQVSGRSTFCKSKVSSSMLCALWWYPSMSRFHLLLPWDFCLPGRSRKLLSTPADFWCLVYLYTQRPRRVLVLDDLRSRPSLLAVPRHSCHGSHPRVEASFRRHLVVEWHPRDLLLIKISLPETISPCGRVWGDSTKPKPFVTSLRRSDKTYSLSVGGGEGDFNPSRLGVGSNSVKFS